MLLDDFKITVTERLGKTSRDHILSNIYVKETSHAETEYQMDQTLFSKTSLHSFEMANRNL
jgi:hypothetical protein